MAIRATNNLALLFLRKSHNIIAPNITFPDPNPKKATTTNIIMLQIAIMVENAVDKLGAIIFF